LTTLYLVSAKNNDKVGSSRSVGASMAFSLVSECS
jgi:hypothetical protein